MKIIFLDIDEVLCGVRTIIAYRGAGDMSRTPLPSLEAWREHTKLDPIACKLLARIIEETESNVVISSTWRLGVDFNLFNDMFEAWGIPRVCVGCTQQTGAQRGYDIALWLSEYPYVSDWIIIDDSSDMLDSQMPRFVHVNGEYGLGYKDYERAVTLLGKV